MNDVVKIALPLSVNRLFTYYLPEGAAVDECIGRRALVPFGKRMLTGVVVSASESEGLKNIKTIDEILDEEPAFSESMLEFTKWVADYYMSTWGDVLKAALPQGMTPRSLLRVNVIRNLAPDELDKMKKRAPKRAAVYEKLLEHTGFVSADWLARDLQIPNISSFIRALETAGYIECERVVEKDLKPKTQKALTLSEKALEDEEFLKRSLDELDRRAPKQSLLLAHIYLQGKMESRTPLLADAIRETGSPASAAKALAEKGLIKILDVEIDRAAYDQGGGLSSRDESQLDLTVEQKSALGEISKAIEEEKFSPFLLHGVTGSGKTLVYIHAIKKARELGKTALILVPEISLTPQLIDRFEMVFPGEIAVVHSRMSEGARYDAWRAVRRGKAGIILGVRSAIFAPLENIGLIVVDEEHEFTYKQDSGGPRYHARDCAIVRGRMEQAAVVLGSATPSLESMFNARSGKYKLLEIKGRADGAALPAIRAVDTLEERKAGMFHKGFSNILIEAIIERIEKKEGVILLQNRRGFSSMLECPDCGDIPMCENCAVSLTYHKKHHQLRCHYCGYTISSFSACRACGYPELKEVGAGTQRIEDELAVALKNKGVESSIARMDLDTTTRKGSHRRILQDFSSGKTDILLGTQMVAKGLDFERVTLVGVINADLQMFLPDFRASERAFQLLTQVSGRAGRTSKKPGEVIIQTSHPEKGAIRAVLAGSYNAFYEEEMELRRSVFYPPYCRFVQVEFSGKNEKEVEKHANLFNGLIPKNEKAFSVSETITPRISRIRSMFRRVIVIKDDKKADPSGGRLRHYLSHAMNVYRENHAKAAVKFTIDIDSYSGF